MKTKTTYLNELDAIRLENEQLSEWLREAQEKIIKQDAVIQRLVKYPQPFIRHIEKLSGSRHIALHNFERLDGHPYKEIKQTFSIMPDGGVI